MRVRFTAVLALVAVVAMGAFASPVRGEAPGPGAVRFHPSPVRTPGDALLAPEHVSGSAGCGFEGCHPDITAQWSASAHHFSSFNNPFYEKAVDLLMEEDGGREKARWCAGCHDPALLLTGRFEQDFDREEALAVEGVGCLICHAMEDDVDLRGNGGYLLAETPGVPMADSPVAAARDLGRRQLRARPGEHKNALLRPIHQRAELCMACHKVSVPPAINGYRWKRGQDEYDAWHASGVSGNSATSFHLSAQGRTCIDCHMNEVASEDQGNDMGRVASHRFAAANSALPHLRGDDEQLAAVERFLSSGVVGLDIAAVEIDDGELVAPASTALVNAGASLRLYVVATNRGVGHAFPGGTIDSHEAWIQLRVSDASGRVVLASGDLREDLSVDSRARIYRGRMLGPDAELLEKRNVQEWVASAYTNTILPGTSDVARYTFLVPEDAVLPLRVEASLNYRKFHPRFARWVIAGDHEGEGDVPEIPIVTMAIAEAVMDGRAEAEDFDRLNELGIALFLQGDRLRAARMFQRVADIAPSQPDGPLNLARVALADGDLAAAEVAIRAAADRCEQNHPTLGWLRGRLAMARGQHEAAAEAFFAVLEQKPYDRTVLADLGRARYLVGDFENSLGTFEGLLAIDPESLVGFNGQLLASRALGYDLSELATKVEYYKPAESEGAVAGRYLRANAAENQQAQAMWEYVHEEDRH